MKVEEVIESNHMTNQPSVIENNELLRISEAAKAINMSPSFLRKAAREGNGPSRVRLGRVILYPRTALQQYVSERMEGRGQC
jgi:predicted DNA-binding transcriptional regulator AlpA